MLWILSACMSAVFAASSTLIVKKYVKSINPTVVTTLQSVVILIFSFIITCITGEFENPGALGAASILFMILSGFGTGLSWLCYYRALSLGDADKVMPIEKANIVLTLLIAITFFRERSHLPIKLAGILVISWGLILLLIKPRKKPVQKAQDSGWLKYALLASFFAAVNTVFSKLGISGMNANFGTFLNTVAALVIVLLFLVVKKDLPLLFSVTGREAVYIIFSGMASGCCFLTYYYAIKYGPMTAVAPLNKMSVPLVILCSRFFLDEKLSRREGTGLAGIVIGMMGIAIVS